MSFKKVEIYLVPIILPRNGSLQLDGKMYAKGGFIPSRQKIKANNEIMNSVSVCEIDRSDVFDTHF